MTISIPLFSPDHLDTLEGISADMFDDNEYSECLTGDSVDMTEPDRKVVDALKGKVGVWAEYGAGKMVQQVLKGGLRLNFSGKLPGAYQERNNKSFRENEAFGVEQVQNCLRTG